jgi:hypothetical protein
MDKTTRTLYIIGMFVTCGVVMAVVGGTPLGTGVWVAVLMAFMLPLMRRPLRPGDTLLSVLLAGVGAGVFVFAFRDLLGGEVGANTALIVSLVAAPLLVVIAAYVAFQLQKNNR